MMIMMMQVLQIKNFLYMRLRLKNGLTIFLQVLTNTYDGKFVFIQYIVHLGIMLSNERTYV